MCSVEQSNADGTAREFPLQAAVLYDSLVHEAVHMSGVRDEGEAECRAVRAVGQAAAALGVTRPDIETLAGRVHAAKPPEYRRVC